MFIYLLCAPKLIKKFKTSMSRSGFSQCPLCSRSKPVLPVSAGTGGCDFSRQPFTGGKAVASSTPSPRKGGRPLPPGVTVGEDPPAWSLPFAQSLRTKRRHRRSARSSPEPRARGPRSPKRSVCGAGFTRQQPSDSAGCGALAFAEHRK